VLGFLGDCKDIDGVVPSVDESGIIAVSLFPTQLAALSVPRARTNINIENDRILFSIWLLHRLTPTFRSLV
jgi:hypothetical protein